MGSIIMKALNESNETSFERGSNTIVTGYKLSLIAENDVHYKLRPIFMGDFLDI